MNSVSHTPSITRKDEDSADSSDAATPLTSVNRHYPQWTLDPTDIIPPNKSP